MIFDQLARASRYVGLEQDFAAAFNYLSTHDLAGLPPGRIDLQGNDLYALVQEYSTKPFEQGAWEAHRRYIDVQCLVSGRERIYCAPLERLRAGVYVPEKDFLPLTGSGPWLDLSAGDFAIFFPEDAHMPGRTIEGPTAVKKVVVKVRV